MFKHIFEWFPAYLANLPGSFLRRRAEGLQHIIFLFVDHFELRAIPPRLERWMEIFPQLCAKHRDSDGHPPKHTWFYPLDGMIESELVELGKLVNAGLGEVELHWHHDHDTSESFRLKIREGLRIFQKHGFLKPVGNGKPGSFAFIHGNWSLDNSRGENYCGVDNEIDLLIEAGCYADFTFPALFQKAQPPILNCIYYANDDGRPKSYRKGRRAKVGLIPAENELMIFLGPLTVNWTDWRFKWHPRLEDGDINGSCSHADPKRVGCWIEQRICVINRPEWIFVKVFCHGAQDHEAVLGDATDAMFTHLESKYNDGINYQLHYVTAREAYNIVKAAEAGKTGNPGEYRDFLIPNHLDGRQ